MLRARNLKSVQVVRQTGDPARWGGGSTAETISETQGWIQPVPLRVRQAAAIAGVPVPASVAYLLPSAPVAEPGFTLRSGALTYHPIGDAEDVGGVGEYWRVLLASPEQITDGTA